MKSKIVVMLIASLPLVAFAEVPLAQKTWVNPLFKVDPPVGEGPFVELKDGSLMIVRGNATGTSKDNGKTWSEPRPIYEGGKPGIPQQGTMLKTREGAIVLVYMDESTFYWEWDDSRGEPNGEPRLDVWAIRSLDDGKTWIDRQLIFKGYCGALIDIIQTRSGHIVVPVQRYIADPARHGTCTYVSADNGKTWRRSNIIDMGGVGGHDGAFEATLVELKDGRLYMLLRTAWDRFWEAYSWDKGLSWRQIGPGPSTIPTSSSPGYMMRLASGRIALVWNSPPAGGKPRPLAEVLGQLPPRKGDEYFYATSNPQMTRTEVSIAFSEDEGQDVDRAHSHQAGA